MVEIRRGALFKFNTSAACVPRSVEKEEELRALTEELGRLKAIQAAAQVRLVAPHLDDVILSSLSSRRVVASSSVSRLVSSRHDAGISSRRASPRDATISSHLASPRGGGMHLTSSGLSAAHLASR